MNYVAKQEQEMSTLERKGWQHVATISLETLHSAQSRGKYPEGSKWFWSTGAVYAPPSKGN